jgi:nicotinate-nucleotide pyrophosphorylase (carboxylating)
LARKTHDHGKELTFKNKAYEEVVRLYTLEEMRRDGVVDVTTTLIFPKKKDVSVVVVAKSSGVFAGRQEVEFFLKKCGVVKARFLKKDGEKFKKGEVVLKMSGDVRPILYFERVLLNVIGRMSGIATLTSACVKRAGDVLVVPTRKTLWGLLDKRACSVGGGGTHRLGLDHSVLVKDNHLDAHGDFNEVCRKVLRLKKVSEFLEIEVETKAKAVRAARLIAMAMTDLPCVLMLDNFSPWRIKETVEELRRSKLFDSVLLEASGGITLKNIASYARSGVDIVSLGSLTHSAPHLDFSLKVVKSHT